MNTSVIQDRDAHKSRALTLPSTPGHQLVSLLAGPPRNAPAWPVLTPGLQRALVSSARPPAPRWSVRPTPPFLFWGPLRPRGCPKQTRLVAPTPGVWRGPREGSSTHTGVVCKHHHSRAALGSPGDTGSREVARPCTPASTACGFGGHGYTAPRKPASYPLKEPGKSCKGRASLPHLLQSSRSTQGHTAVCGSQSSVLTT